MPRWRQNPITHELEPVGSEVPEGGTTILANFEPIVSPIDGSVISSRSEYREHCKKHNVVPQAEFSDDYIAKKRREREEFFTNGGSPQERFRAKQEIYEAIVRAENGT
ncbi:MAG: hypothetical protein LC687_06040 [Actinobacteria bacterium]|nr:hypothetical protein [Actinomycetota bacterium]